MFPEEQTLAMKSGAVAALLGAAATPLHPWKVDTMRIFTPAICIPVLLMSGTAALAAPGDAIGSAVTVTPRSIGNGSARPPF